MVILPSDFTAIKYPGYFWNIKEKKLYTMKVTGVLRPLKKSNPNQYNYFRTGYEVSHHAGKDSLKYNILIR